jgi:hypothetical protein
MLVPRRVLFKLFKKRNGITNNFCARTTPRAQRERGNYNDNTDNISASPTLLSGKINKNYTPQAPMLGARRGCLSCR